MKKTITAALASVLFLGLAGSVLAADAPGAKPIVLKNTVKMKAVVVAIDQANREVTLKGEKGNFLTLSVDPSVKRFASMKVGDTVNAEYYESVAYDVKKPGTAAAPDTITQEAGKISGTKPGGGVANVDVTTVTITAIDPVAPTITVRGSDGQPMTFAVRHPEYLKQVKVGDVVVVTKTEALMVAVDAPK